MIENFSESELLNLCENRRNFWWISALVLKNRYVGPVGPLSPYLTKKPVYKSQQRFFALSVADLGTNDPTPNDFSCGIGGMISGIG